MKWDCTTADENSAIGTVLRAVPSLPVNDNVVVAKCARYSLAVPYRWHTEVFSEQDEQDYLRGK